jgi:DNA repair photolyase
VRVLVAPIIPGLNDTEIPSLLAAAKEAGAQHAAFTMLRLPLTVAPVFLEWLEREQPGRAKKIEGRIRGMRGGKLNSTEFGDRMSGSGEMADQIANLFRLFAKKHGLDGGLPPYDCTRFRRPKPKTGQLWLF